MTETDILSCRQNLLNQTTQQQKHTSLNLQSVLKRDKEFIELRQRLKSIDLQSLYDIHPYSFQYPSPQQLQQILSLHKPTPQQIRFIFQRWKLQLINKHEKAIFFKSIVQVRRGLGKKFFTVYYMCKQCQSFVIIVFLDNGQKKVKKTNLIHVHYPRLRYQKSTNKEKILQLIQELQVQQMNDQYILTQQTNIFHRKSMTILQYRYFYRRISKKTYERMGFLGYFKKKFSSEEIEVIMDEKQEEAEKILLYKKWLKHNCLQKQLIKQRLYHTMKRLKAGGANDSQEDDYDIDFDDQSHHHKLSTKKTSIKKKSTTLRKKQKKQPRDKSTRKINSRNLYNEEDDDQFQQSGDKFQSDYENSDVEKEEACLKYETEDNEGELIEEERKEKDAFINNNNCYGNNKENGKLQRTESSLNKPTICPNISTRGRLRNILQPGVLSGNSITAQQQFFKYLIFVPTKSKLSYQKYIEKYKICHQKQQKQCFIYSREVYVFIYKAYLPRDFDRVQFVIIYTGNKGYQVDELLFVGVVKEVPLLSKDKRVDRLLRSKQQSMLYQQVIIRGFHALSGGIFPTLFIINHHPQLHTAIQSINSQNILPHPLNILYNPESMLTHYYSMISKHIKKNTLYDINFQLYLRANLYQIIYSRSEEGFEYYFKELKHFLERLEELDENVGDGNKRNVTKSYSVIMDQFLAQSHRFCFSKLILDNNSPPSSQQHTHPH